MYPNQLFLNALWMPAQTSETDLTYKILLLLKTVEFLEPTAATKDNIRLQYLVKYATRTASEFIESQLGLTFDQLTVLHIRMKLPLTVLKNNLKQTRLTSLLQLADLATKLFAGMSTMEESEHLIIEAVSEISKAWKTPEGHERQGSPSSEENTWSSHQTRHACLQQTRPIFNENGAPSVQSGQCSSCAQEEEVHQKEEIKPHSSHAKQEGQHQPEPPLPSAPTDLPAESTFNDQEENASLPASNPEKAPSTRKKSSCQNQPTKPISKVSQSKPVGRKGNTKKCTRKRNTKKSVKNQSIINQSNNQSINQSIKQSIPHSIEESIKENISQSITRSITKPITASINKSVKESITNRANLPRKEDSSDDNESTRMTETVFSGSVKEPQIFDIQREPQHVVFSKGEPAPAFLFKIIKKKLMKWNKVLRRGRIKFVFQSKE